VEGDVDHGGTLRSWPEVQVYDETTGPLGEQHLSAMRDTLAPPLGWVLEAAFGGLFALVALLLGFRRAPLDGSARNLHARAIAHAAVAFTAAALFATPLMVAWYAGLVTRGR
jgi:hypothetical protein